MLASDSDDMIETSSLTDDTIVHPLLKSLPIGMSDSVLLGQELHEYIVEPCVDWLF